MESIETNINLIDNRAVELNVVGWIFTGFMILIVVLKLCRVGTTTKLGWDDFLIFFSAALSIITTSLISYAVSLGYSYHTIAIIQAHGVKQFEKALEVAVIAFPFNIASFSLPNIAIAILVVRILNPNKRRAIFLYTIVTLQVIFAIVNIFLVFFQCQPFRKLWIPEAQGTCWDADVFNDFSYWVASYTAMTDIILAIVPITTFWKLQMPRSTKFGISIMMGLTLFSAIATIIKATQLPLFEDKRDILYKGTPLIIWSLIEQNIVIIAACIPTLRPWRPIFCRKSTRIKSSPDTIKQNQSPSSPKLKSIPRQVSSSEQLFATNVDTLVESPSHYSTSGNKSFNDEIPNMEECV